MTRSELQTRIQALLQGERLQAVSFLKLHAWLLIADVTCAGMSMGRQGVLSDVVVAGGSSADFVTFEIQERRVNWQLVHVASPSCGILEGAGPSAEFQQALDVVDHWWQLSVREQPLFAVPASAAGLVSRYDFRVVIGDSRRQSLAERQAVRLHRRSDLRIRSFQWLFEKLHHYTDAEIRVFERV